MIMTKLITSILEERKKTLFVFFYEFQPQVIGKSAEDPGNLELISAGYPQE